MVFVALFELLKQLQKFGLQCYGIGATSTATRFIFLGSVMKMWWIH